MTNFNDAQLRRLDITLLLTFDEVMASGKLSAAASRLGLTQSAISHAVKRLREIFDDELFVRTPRGVQPTTRALALRAPVSEALRLLGGAVGSASFDPEHDERVFRIAATDYETSLFAPLLLDADLASVSPRYIFRALIRRDAIEAIAGRAMSTFSSATLGTKGAPAMLLRCSTRIIWWWRGKVIPH